MPKEVGAKEVVMSEPERDAEVEDNALLAEFAERFEAGEVEVDGTSATRLPCELFGIYTELWRLVMDDRPHRSSMDEQSGKPSLSRTSARTSSSV